MPSQLASLGAGGANAADSSLLTALVAYYALEEASGTRADATGRGNDLTPTNTPGNTSGKVGNGVALVAASSHYLVRSSTSDLECGNVDFTLAFWMNFTTVINLMTVVCKDQTSVSRSYRVDYNNSALRFFTFQSGGGVAGQIAPAFTPATGTWYFVCAWQDVTANTVNLQIDNGSVNTATRTATPGTTAADFTVGKGASASAQYFNGIVDEIGLWKRVLTSTERTTLYNSGAGRTYPFTGT